MNSAPAFTHFDSRWLLLVNSGKVVHLWNVDGRIGYVDRSQPDPNHWVWLTEEMLSKTRPYSGTHKTQIQPDLELEEEVPLGSNPVGS